MGDPQPHAGARSPLLQLATAGRWESATILPVDASSLGAVDTWLADARAVGEGAMEIVYPWHEQRALLGVRLRGEALGSIARVVQALVDSRVALDLHNGVETMRATFGRSMLDADHVAAIDVGVFNLWSSMPVHRLWRGPGRIPPGAALAEDLVRDAPWPAHTPAPLLLEAAWTAPVHHWAGVTVSTPQADQFALDASLVEAGLALLNSSCRS